MSPITKTFVVIHVILSMLLTAGVVVFVNRVDQYQTIVKDERGRRLAAEAAAGIASASEASTKEALNRMSDQLASQATAAKKDADAAAASLLALNTQLADAQKQLAIVQAQNTQLSTGMTASQTAQTQLNTQLAELRATVDDLQKKKLELDTTVADLTNQRDVLERQRRDLAERVSMLETTNTSYAQLLQRHNIPTGAAANQDFLSPPINGVVREVRVIEQVPYATISVGSADAVTKGMKFRVIDRNKGEFLGLLTVESVEANEASGRLYGPAVNRVTRGAEVRTQL